jgi:hypothetical protein
MFSYTFENESSDIYKFERKTRKKSTYNHIYIYMNRMISSRITLEIINAIAKADQIHSNNSVVVDSSAMKCRPTERNFYSLFQRNQKKTCTFSRSNVPSGDSPSLRQLLQYGCTHRLGADCLYRIIWPRVGYGYGQTN